MNNVTFISQELPSTGQIIEYAIIDRGNGEFTSMPKDVYDAMQAQQQLGGNL